MSAIGKGDWVQCIDASAGPGCCWWAGEEIAEGSVYVVEDCFINELSGRPNVALLGRDRSAFSAVKGHRLGYRVDRFRPLGGNAKTLTAPPIRISEDA